MKAFADALPATLTRAQRIVLAEVSPCFRARLLLEDEGSRAPRFRLDELQRIREDVGRAILFEKDGRKRRSLSHVSQVVDKTVARFFEIDAIPASQRLYQFRVALEGIAPEIWRRFQVKDCTLARLHRHIQGVMGWWDYHIYSFEVKGIEYADPELVDEFYGEDAHSARLSDLVPKDGNRMRFLYHYDFGDNWRHVVLFEGCLPADPKQSYPACIEGERACPPEDVGGPHGFEQYLAALGDPNHEEHQSYVKWRGAYDPQDFSRDAATSRMRRR